jgi:hypothetical protein
MIEFKEICLSNPLFAYQKRFLNKKAQKVLFSIKSWVASLGNIPIKVSNNLFDKLVQPVLTYNAEISFMDSYLTYYRKIAILWVMFFILKNYSDSQCCWKKYSDFGEGKKKWFRVFVI